MNETDEAIYRRFLQYRSEEDMRLLFDRYRESLILFLIGYVRNADDAEELMMDAFAVAASGTASFSGRSSFKTWLFSIARNQAGTFLRKQRRSFAAMTETRTETGNPPELTLLRQEENRQLYRALETLPEDYRHVLYLLYFERMSREEACAVMRKTKKQIYNLAERGRKALREALERMEFDDAQYR